MFRNLAHLYVQDEWLAAHDDDSHEAPWFADGVSRAMLALADQLEAEG